MDQRQMKKNAKSKSRSKESPESKRASRGAFQASRSKLTPIAAPVAVSYRERFPNKRAGSRRIVNSEMMGDVLAMNGASSFRVNAWEINPGILLSFPWLRYAAIQFQQYRFHKLRFRYVPRCSTETTGVVTISPDYEMNDDPPSSTLEAANTQDSVQDAPWREIVCDIDIAAAFAVGNRKYIRTMMVPGEQCTYDACRLYVVTDGFDGTVEKPGSLWVDYDVELFVPQSSDANTLSTGMTRATVLLPSAKTYTTGVTDEQTFAALNESRNGCRASLDAGGTDLTVLAGTYLLSGFIRFQDTANERFFASITIFQDGSAPVGTPMVACQDVMGSSVGCTTSVPVCCYFRAIATSTITVRVLLVGAAGTLTSPANQSQLVLTVV